MPAAAATDAAATEATAPAKLSVAAIRQQAINALGNGRGKALGQTDPSSLPGNWARDALPGKPVAAPEYLPALSYTGPARTEDWRDIDGTLRTRSVLPDGTVICSHSNTLLPNSNFETTLMMHAYCGKISGSGYSNRNSLSKYHPGN